jgi:glycosyltransferase involved in cell wall biosynthesis
MLFPEALAHKRWKKRLGWWLFQRRDFLGASLIHAASDAELHAIRRAGWNGRVVVAPNGVMIPKVSSQKNPNQHRRAMFLGRLHRQKGLEDLLAAWGAVRPTGWELIVVGPDEDGTLARCQQQAREHHIESDITWHGPARSDQTADLLASAELFVLPSHFESFGLAIAEALAVGTPVICNRASPWQQVTTQGCGWWIECGVGPLAESLKVATSLPPDELRRMGERGRAWMERDFSWASVARTIVDAYA